MAESKVVRLSERLVNALEEYRDLRIKCCDVYIHGSKDHWNRQKRLYSKKSLTDLLEECVFGSNVDLQTFLDDMEYLKNEKEEGKN